MRIFEPKILILFRLVGKQGWLHVFRMKTIKLQLRSTFKRQSWPRYGVSTTYNIVGICWFCKDVAKCDRWPTYKGGQLHKFYCTKTNKHHSQKLRATLAAWHTNVAKLGSSFKSKKVEAIWHVYFTKFFPTLVEENSTHLPQRYVHLYDHSRLITDKMDSLNLLAPEFYI
jgi:hypothetical protein